MPMKTENKTNHYIDLHAHLDGCITVDIAKKLAALQQITLPAATDEELLSLLSVPDTCENLNDFLKCFDLPLSLLQTEEALEEAVYLILSEMRKDGVIYAELRFAPQFHTQKGMTQETAIQSALRGLKKSPIPGNLILCCMRGSSNQQENMETLDLARRYLTEDGGVVAAIRIFLRKQKSTTFHLRSMQVKPAMPRMSKQPSVWEHPGSGMECVSQEMKR